MLVVNKSKLTQVIYSGTSSLPTMINPGTIFESNPYNNLLDEFFEPFSHQYLEKIHSVTFIRQYALGDLLQLIAAIRVLKIHRPNIQNVAISTSEDYRRALKDIYTDITFLTFRPTSVIQNSDLIINLDGILESDHSENNIERQVHRLNIFLQTFGLEGIEYGNLELWAPITMKKYNFCKKRKLVGLQIRGSGKMKTLPYDYIQKLARTLAKHYDIVILDHEKEKGFEGEGIINLCGKLDVHRCIAVLHELDCCITMDSGMLWMCHAANCPICTLLGPTREQERVSLHPQYPEKAKSIDLAKMIGCSPCFETTGTCKRQIDCMNKFPRGKLTTEILKILKTILGE